jgi:DNA-directed RNA polymerase specialized sigma24 family protein
MLNQHVLVLVLSYLDKRDKSLASAAELIAWDAFRRECEALISLAIRRVRAARGASDDIFQDVWLALFDDLPRYCLDPGDKTFESWVSSIASHVVWNYVRRPSRRREQPLSVDPATVLLDEELGPEAELELMQENEHFHSLVR